MIDSLSRYLKYYLTYMYKITIHCVFYQRHAKFRSYLEQQTSYDIASC